MKVKGKKGKEKEIKNEQEYKKIEDSKTKKMRWKKRERRMRTSGRKK